MALMLSAIGLGQALLGLGDQKEGRVAYQLIYLPSSHTYPLIYTYPLISTFSCISTLSRITPPPSSPGLMAAKRIFDSIPTHPHIYPTLSYIYPLIYLSSHILLPGLMAAKRIFIPTYPLMFIYPLLNNSPSSSSSSSSSPPGMLAAKRIFDSIEDGVNSSIDGLSQTGLKPPHRATGACVLSHLSHLSLLRPPTPPPPVTPHASTPLPRAATGRIELKNVSFRYPTRPEMEVCKDFSLIIEPGTTVALVGPSGSGKSTIMNLLLRNYDPLEGTPTYTHLIIHPIALFNTPSHTL